MEGYFVITKDAEDEDSKKIKETLNASKFVNLHCTRTFNRLTNGEFKKQANSAVTHLRNRQEEARERRKQYNSRDDIKKRIKEYNMRPEVKEKKRQERLRKRKILSLVPREVIEKVYKEPIETNTQ